MPDEKHPSALKAIRAKCLECVCGNPYEVAQCVITDCALYPWRFGKNPYRVISEEHRAKLVEQGRKNAVYLKRKGEGV